jgi:hypothetical protein
MPLKHFVTGERNLHDFVAVEPRLPNVPFHPDRDISPEDKEEIWGYIQASIERTLGGHDPMTLDHHVFNFLPAMKVLGVELPDIQSVPSESKRLRRFLEHLHSSEVIKLHHQLGVAFVMALIGKQHRVSKVIIEPCSINIASCHRTEATKYLLGYKKNPGSRIRQLLRVRLEAVDRKSIGILLEDAVCWRFIGEQPVISQAQWGAAFSKLNEHRELKEWDTFLEIGMNMAILSAKEIQMTENGLELVWPDAPHTSNTPLPSFRKELSQVLHAS